MSSLISNAARQLLEWASFGHWPLRGTLNNQGLPHDGGGSASISSPYNPDIRLGRSARNKRYSPGLVSLFENLPEELGLQVLDLGLPKQLTTQCFTDMGHIVTGADLLKSFHEFKQEREDQTVSASDADRFVASNLNYPRHTFQAVLAWDVLEHLDEEVMHSAIYKIVQILKPGGNCLAFFHVESQGMVIPVHEWTILHQESLLFKRVYQRQLQMQFTSHKLDQLFPQFKDVHLFLKQDALQEVLLVR